MGKRLFWGVMCLISLLNGACFVLASHGAMVPGADGADNQAALLFIPALWVVAAQVLIVLNVCTWIYGRRIGGGHKLRILSVFRLAGLRGRALWRRLAFFALVCLLMLLGYALFAAGVWAAGYALSGGLLLVCLYAWRRAGATGRRG